MSTLVYMGNVILYFILYISLQRGLFKDLNDHLLEECEKYNI